MAGDLGVRHLALVLVSKPAAKLHALVGTSHDLPAGPSDQFFDWIAIIEQKLRTTIVVKDGRRGI